MDRESEEDLKIKNRIPKLWSKDEIEEDAHRVTLKMFSNILG